MPLRNNSSPTPSYLYQKKTELILFFENVIAYNTMTDAAKASFNEKSNRIEESEKNLNLIDLKSTTGTLTGFQREVLVKEREQLAYSKSTLIVNQSLALNNIYYSLTKLYSFFYEIVQDYGEGFINKAQFSIHLQDYKKMVKLLHESKIEGLDYQVKSYTQIVLTTSNLKDEKPSTRKKARA